MTPRQVLISAGAAAAAAGFSAAACRWAADRLPPPAALADPAAGSGGRWLRRNHAGAPVTLLEGPAAVGGILAGAAVLATATPRLAGAVAAAALGSGAVGAFDDLYGSAQARGFRGHLRALRAGTVTSGMVKIVGVGLSSLAAAAILASERGGPTGRRLLEVGVDTAVTAGMANLANLFDLRPGRSGKVILLVALPFATSGAAPAFGSALGALPTDLAARSMLGDCGANALGAAAATAMVGRVPLAGRLAALVAVVALNLASERVSFTAVIERVRLLRWLDGLGRMPASTGAAEGA